MTSLYLFCLIVGGGLLLVSLLGFGDDTDLEMDADADAGGGWGMAREFFSIRALIYFLAGFGATGFLLETLTAASDTAALLWALLVGVIAAAAVGAAFGFLRRSESGLVAGGHDYLVGMPAEVVLPVMGDRRGKIRLIASGREVELLARRFSPEDSDCARGTTVVVVDMDGDTALVTPAPFLPPDSA